jgi:Protein of unknown function (DUF3551)
MWLSSLQQSLKTLARCTRATYLRSGLGLHPATRDETKKMRAIWKLGVPAATFVVAATLGAFTPTSATAGDYCRTDVTGHMTGCGFDTMQQCKDASSGIGGDCFRDPKLGNSSASNGQNGQNAFAYQPNAPRATKRARNAAESRQ